jgi:hypothetical protein
MMSFSTRNLPTVFAAVFLSFPGLRTPASLVEKSIVSVDHLTNQSLVSSRTCRVARWSDPRVAAKAGGRSARQLLVRDFPIPRRIAGVGFSTVSLKVPV